MFGDTHFSHLGCILGNVPSAWGRAEIECDFIKCAMETAVTTGGFVDADSGDLLWWNSKLNHCKMEQKM